MINNSTSQGNIRFYYFQVRWINVCIEIEIYWKIIYFNRNVLLNANGPPATECFPIFKTTLSENPIISKFCSKFSPALAAIAIRFASLVIYIAIYPMRSWRKSQSSVGAVVRRRVRSAKRYTWLSRNTCIWKTRSARYAGAQSTYMYLVAATIRRPKRTTKNRFKKNERTL